jgi:hypothetical protein
MSLDCFDLDRGFCFAARFFLPRQILNWILYSFCIFLRDRLKKLTDFWTQIINFLASNWETALYLFQFLLKNHAFRFNHKCLGC